MIGSRHEENRCIASTFSVRCRIRELCRVIRSSSFFQMSWIFGYKKPGSDLPPPPPPSSSIGNFDGSAAPPSGNSGNDQSSGGKAFAGRESIYKFDSTALERAAQAAKELERSRKCFSRDESPHRRCFLEYATQAFDVVKMQEQTKQLEIQKQMKVSEDILSHVDRTSFFLRRNILNTKRRSDSNINNN